MKRYLNYYKFFFILLFLSFTFICSVFLLLTQKTQVQSEIPLKDVIIDELNDLKYFPFNGEDLIFDHRTEITVPKSQTDLLSTFESKLWCKFFLLSVYVTMYLNDIQRSEFYATIGLDARQFDKYVIVKTNQSAGTLFPVIYDTENPEFFELMEVCADANQKLIDIEKSNDNGISKLVQKLPVYLQMASGLLQLYLLPVIETKFSWTKEDYQVA